MKYALREKEEQLSQAKMDHRTKLKGKELSQLKEHIRKQEDEMKDLKHYVELQKRDLEIKELERKNMGKTEDDEDDHSYCNDDESESDSDSDGDNSTSGTDSDDDDLNCLRFIF